MKIHNKEKSTSKSVADSKRLKIFTIAGLLIVFFCIGFGCKFLLRYYNNSTEIQTNPIHAEAVLKNLAVGMRTYSAMNGGGGNTGFTSDISKIKDYVSQDAFHSLQDINPSPYHGYIVKLSENPIGDNFENNFKFIAYPSKGYVGQSFQIDKYEQVEPIDPLEPNKNNSKHSMNTDTVERTQNKTFI